MSLKPNRLPRKLKKQIPYGVYCYKGVKFDTDTGVYHIKPCIFYDRIKNIEKPIDQQGELDAEYPNELIGWCKLLKCEIDDQCKSCSIKIN
jgi:hypothetical protein